MKRLMIHATALVMTFFVPVLSSAQDTGSVLEAWALFCGIDLKDG